MIFDLHNDILTDASFQNLSLSSYMGANKIIFALWTTQMRKLPVIPNEAISIAIEDMGFIGGIDELIGILNDNRIHYCGLTWNYDNSLAGGALGHDKLSHKGKQFINELNKRKIPLDLAHLNEKSFFDCIDCADKFLVSHTACRRKYDHLRCVNDSQINNVLSCGGIVGLSPVQAFIGGDNIRCYVEAIDEFAQEFGTGGLCIGTDFFGAQPLMGLDDYDKFNRLEIMLFSRGFNAIDIKNIFYNNANNFFT